VYQGSKDGFKAEDYHRCVTEVKSLLVVVLSLDNKIFGGYSENSGVMDNGFVSSKEAFLFSCEERKVFKVVDSNKAFYWKEKLGAVFGEADLVIGDQCNVADSCRAARVGRSYEGGGDLTGSESEKFGVREIEVYQVSWEVKKAIKILKEEN